MRFFWGAGWGKDPNPCPAVRFPGVRMQKPPIRAPLGWQKAAGPWLRPQQGGGGGRAGGQAGEGTPRSITVRSFPKSQRQACIGGGGGAAGTRGRSCPWRGAGLARAGARWGRARGSPLSRGPGGGARRGTKPSAGRGSRQKGIRAHSPRGSRLGDRGPGPRGWARCRPSLGPVCPERAGRARERPRPRERGLGAGPGAGTAGGAARGRARGGAAGRGPGRKWGGGPWGAPWGALEAHKGDQ